MKFLKKRGFIILFALLFLFLISFCFAGHLIHRFIRNIVADSPILIEDKLYTEAVDDFFAALDRGDAEGIRTMFSRTVQSKDVDLNEQIQKLITLYPGPTDVSKRDPLTSGHYLTDFGKRTSAINATFPVVSNGIYYWCHFELTYENDFDEDEIGITKVLFFTADEYCQCRYDDTWKLPEEQGLTVYAETILNCEVRCIGNSPYKYTPTDTPLNLTEVKDFFEDSNRFSAFTDQFGTPNASNIYYIYELPEENNQPRYLRVGVDERSDEIYDVSVVDDFNWLYSVWNNES